MSSMRSASSMTSIEQPVSRILPRPNRSIRRPGVAISTSTPFSSALIWSPIDTPPISRAIESLWPAPYFSKFSATCAASFARRFEDEAARHARTAAGVRQDVDHRQHEGGGLAGAGLRDPDQVAHHEDAGDRLRLVGVGFAVARVGDRGQEFGGEPRSAKLMPKGSCKGPEIDAHGAARRAARLPIWARKSRKAWVGRMTARVCLPGDAGPASRILRGTATEDEQHQGYEKPERDRSTLAARRSGWRRGRRSPA